MIYSIYNGIMEYDGHLAHLKKEAYGLIQTRRAKLGRCTFKMENNITFRFVLYSDYTVAEGHKN